MTWNEANHACMELDPDDEATLTSVESKEENDFILSLLEINRNRKVRISGQKFLPKAETDQNRAVSAERASFGRKWLILAETDLFQYLLTLLLSDKIEPFCRKQTLSAKTVSLCSSAVSAEIAEMVSASFYNAIASLFLQKLKLCPFLLISSPFVMIIPLGLEERTRLRRVSGGK